jgi:DNA-binding transcriptional regulator GbsR (MarR family)
MSDNILILQAVFDIAIVAYILLMKHFDNKEKESMLKLVDSLRGLLEKQKQLIDTANNRIMEQQDKLNHLLEDVKRKNTLLTDLLTTIKNKTYKESLKDKIMHMKNSSVSLDDMAKELNMTKGEIELIIKLYEEEKR